MGDASSLLDFVQVIPPDGQDEAEDIFAFAPGLLFSDDCQTMHGDPSSTIVYKSPVHGEIHLKTADPHGEGERLLFAHYLWNAGLKMARSIETAEWSVEGQKVLELGAGVGLNGIIAILAGADEVIMTDYPAPVLLENLRRNAVKAVPAELRSRYQVQGLCWGDVDSQFAQDHAHLYTRILAADCFWMPHEHANLARSMLHFLDQSFEARVLAIAGFHTGRTKLAGFFKEAVAQGLVIEQIHEEDVEGNKRAWREGEGESENVTERKRWLVVAVLKRAQH